MEELLSDLRGRFGDLLTQSYTRGYLRALKRQGKPIPEDIKLVDKHSLQRSADIESAYFSNFEWRARDTMDRATNGEFTEEEALTKIQADVTRLGKTASARLDMMGTVDAMDGDGLVYVPRIRSRDAHVCPPNDTCSELIAGRVFRVETLRNNAYANFGAPKTRWVPCVPMHPNCQHFAVPAYKKTIEELRKAGITREDIPDEGYYIG